MFDDLKYKFNYIFLYILFIQIITTNSRTSTLWKLNTDEGKITTGFQAQQQEQTNDNNVGIIDVNLHQHLQQQQQQQQPNQQQQHDNDPIFNIITSTIAVYGYTWSKQGGDTYCENHHIYDDERTNSSKSISITNKLKSEIIQLQQQNDVLDCGKPVNFTQFDDLIGVAQRFNHPIVPEPEVAYLFLKKKGTKTLKNFDIDTLERRLKKAKREKPRSVQLYNQIGNFWRIKGDARQSIECFRRALSVSPTNAEVLLNLARVLFNLQYLDDAIHLTRRSLEVQPPDRSAWRQYFTLGEIFKAYGHFQDSILHLKHALELYPQHEPIKQALRDVENIPSSSLNVYTVLIIVFLVLSVLFVILSSNDQNHNQPETPELKVQRHFNRAMAMRSLKGFTPRSLRSRK